MSIDVQLREPLGTDRSTAGDEFVAAVGEDLVAEGHVVAREGSEVRGRIVDVQKGSPGQPPTLTLSIDAVRGASALDVAVEPILIQGERQSKLKRILKGAGAAVAGAVVGKKTAGTKGAIAGAGVGIASVLMTGDHLVLEAGVRIQFRLARSVRAAVPSR